jgi:hypothetical protein
MRNPKRRFLVCYIDPKTGRERLGTGPHAQSVCWYVNVDNVIRFFIAQDHFPAGQYNIYPWPETGYGGPIKAYRRTAYKRS